MSGRKSSRSKRTPDEKIQLHFLVYFPTDHTNDLIKLESAAWPKEFTLNDKLCLQEKDKVNLNYADKDFEAIIVARGESEAKLLKMQDRLDEKTEAEGGIDLNDLSFLEPPPGTTPNDSLSSSMMEVNISSILNGHVFSDNQSENLNGSLNQSTSSAAAPVKRKKAPGKLKQSLKQKPRLWDQQNDDEQEAMDDTPVNVQLLNAIGKLNESIEINTRAICGLRTEMKIQGSSTGRAVDGDAQFDAGFMKAMELVEKRRANSG